MCLPFPLSYSSARVLLPGMHLPWKSCIWNPIEEKVMGKCVSDQQRAGKTLGCSMWFHSNISGYQDFVTDQGWEFLGVAEPGEGVVCRGEGQRGIMLQSPLSKAGMFSRRIELCYLQTNSNSRASPSTTWRLATQLQAFVSHKRKFPVYKSYTRNY